jgi:hypothetical protein
LFSEILAMSWDTIRGNKMRSSLTVLGIVIGITSIVGITSLLRGIRGIFQGPDSTNRSGHDLRSEVFRHHTGRAKPRGPDAPAEHHAERC